MLVCTLALVQWVNLAVLGQLVVFVGQVHNDCTPLPAALPLFAIGLGAMGLFGWRRKRKRGGAALDKIVGAAGEDSGSRNCLLQLFESNAKNCLVDGVLDEQMTGAMAILIIRL